nr:MAG TPA: hypothetical protein [Caudoviricetes sp.]
MVTVIRLVFHIFCSYAQYIVDNFLTITIYSVMIRW